MPLALIVTQALPQTELYFTNHQDLTMAEESASWTHGHTVTITALQDKVCFFQHIIGVKCITFVHPPGIEKDTKER